MIVQNFKIKLLIIFCLFLLLGVIKAPVTFACGGPCQCCACCGGSCSDGWEIKDPNDGSCRCVNCSGGGNECDPNYGGCNVSCGWGTAYNGCGDSRACWAGPCCTSVNPSAATLVLPASRTITVNPSVTLTWTAPASWGNNCGGNSQSYVVYFDTSPNPLATISCPLGSTSCTYSIPTLPAADTGTTYYWRVAASNNGLISYSTTRSIKYMYPGVGSTSVANLSSAIWDSTSGSSCAQTDIYKASKELKINSGDITYATAPSASITVDPTWQTLPTYTIKNVAYGAGRICVDTSHNVIPAGLSYILNCTGLQVDIDGNGTLDGTGSSSAVIADDKCVLLNARDVGIKLDLGFNLTPIHWFNSVNGGDIFAGSTDQKVPGTINTVGGYKSYLITGNGFAFGKGDLTVMDVTSSSVRISESGGYATNIGSSFISMSSFSPPTSATTISNCSNGLSSLNPTHVYQISSACLQSYIGANTTYGLSSDGVAVVYVTGNETSIVTFGAGNKAFKSSGSNKRILFIMTPNVVVSSDLGDAAPTSNTSPAIEAGIVTLGNISFPGKTGASFASPDTTVVLEGPLVAKGVVQSTRNRFLLNTYPTVVVKYNSNYLKFLKSQENLAVLSNYTGKTSHDVTWVYNYED